MKTTRRTLTAAAALVLSLGLGACSQDDSTDGATPTTDGVSTDDSLSTDDGAVTGDSDGATATAPVPTPKG